MTIHECKPSSVTGRCVMCGSTGPCAHDRRAYGDGHAVKTAQDREGHVREAEAVDAPDRPAKPFGQADGELAEPAEPTERHSSMTTKQSAFLAHVGKLYRACVGDPYASSRTIMEADAALQHIVRDARNAGMTPREIAEALQLPLAAVLA